MGIVSLSYSEFGSLSCSENVSFSAFPPFFFFCSILAAHTMLPIS